MFPEDQRSYERARELEQDRILLARILNFRQTEEPQRDDWQAQFDANKEKIGTPENMPYLALFVECGVENEVQSFMLPHEPSPQWETRAIRTESFCGSASFVLDNAVPAEPGLETIQGAHESKIWVYDLNCYPNGPATPGAFGRKFTTPGFYQLLKKERFPEPTQDDKFLPLPRRVYINSPTGPDILALIRTVPSSHAEGLREMVANYLTPSPRPYFRLRISPAWNKPFIFSANLPFYAVSTLDEPDTRTIRGTQRLRKRDSLEFLFPRHSPDAQCEDADPDMPVKAWLHDAVCCIMVTGRNDQYWSCLCFNEDSFMEGQKHRLQTDKEIDEQGGGTLDPITQNDEKKTTPSPRTFTLQGLVAHLKMILEHQEMIQVRFEASITFFTPSTSIDSPEEICPMEMQRWGKKFRITLSRVIDRNANLLRKLKEFLSDNVKLGSDGIPRDRLFQSLQNDNLAMKSLNEIVEIRKSLHDINQELMVLQTNCESIRRERKNDQAEQGYALANEAQAVQKMFKQLAAVQIVFGVLGLVAELFSARADKSDPASWSGFITIVLFSVIIAIGCLVFVFRKHVTDAYQGLGRMASRTNVSHACKNMRRSISSSHVARFYERLRRARPWNAVVQRLGRAISREQMIRAYQRLHRKMFRRRSE